MIRVNAAGSDIWNTADQFHFVYQPLTGDGAIVARVDGLQFTDGWAKGGVMMRASLAAGSAHVLAAITPDHGVAFERRRLAGGTSVRTDGRAGTVPMWLRIERRGKTFTAYRSNDGAAWQEIGTEIVSMTGTVYAGLAVTSHAVSVATTATFSGVALQSLSAASDSPVMPAGWTGADIGTPTHPGSERQGGGLFTVNGAGDGITGKSDQFHFLYKQVSGDADIVARVKAVEYVRATSRGGLMVRTSLAADAANAAMLLRAGTGTIFQRRSTPGANTSTTSIGALEPYWLALQVRGQVVTAFQSADGTTWETAGSMTLAMPAPFYIGLAVTSDGDTATTAALFDNVVVSTAASQNQPPVVSLVAPAAGTTATALANLTVTANASDADGSIARVDFVANGTLIGSATASPYSIAWSNVAAGSYTLTAVAQDNAGATTTSAPVAVTVTAPAAISSTSLSTGSKTTSSLSVMALTAPGDTLPAGWTSIDIGGPAAGSAQYSSGTFTIAGAGPVWNSPDQFRFTYQAFTGDITITSRVVSQTNTDTWAKAGVMIRETLSADARHMSLVATPGHGTILFSRSAIGQPPSQEPLTVGPGAAAWVRLERRGSVVTAYYSSNGTSWTAVGTTTLATSTMYVGLAVSSEMSATTSTAVFDNVTVSAPSALPAGWTSVDVGGAAAAGSAQYSGGTFTIAGAGPVWNAPDQFRFTYQPFTGDITITGRVVSQTNTDTWAKAGVMIREALSADARHTSLVATPGHGTIFFYRSAVGQPPPLEPVTVGPGAAAWVRLERRGSVVTAYYSSDGTAWTAAGSTTLATATMYVGLAVSSEMYGTTSTAVFDNVSITTPTANQVPAVSLSAPASGASFTAPASVTVSATASDSDGTIAKVDFFAGSTLIGSDTTSPYSVTWSNVAAGSYSLTAVATDNAGAATTSAARTITVTGANQVPAVSLTAPASGATFTAPATVTVSANASDTDGTITKVDFFSGSTLIGTDTTSPYSISWSNVAAGTYSLTAVATDNAGATTTSAARSITVTAPSVWPSAWTSIDIGGPAAGSAQYSSGTFTIAGAGPVWNSPDQFRFTYQAFTGDVTITSRVVSQTNTDTWAKAGVMIRETLSADARHISLVATPGHGTIFFYRSAVGQPPPQEPVTVGPGAAAWVRLERRGSLVTAYYSSDGTSWTAAGSTTLATATMYAGLVVSSEMSATTSTAVFDNVTVTAPTPNQAPAVSLTAPASGATFTAPASVTVSATASDSDGTIAKVDFFAGSTLIGSDTTSPYSISWSNVGSGTYSLTAVATDNAGAVTTSAARSITVTAPVWPSAWTSIDIGGPAAAGSAQYANGTFTIAGAGPVWNSPDQFRYTYQAFTGDITITSRVVSQTNTDTWAKAGVMIREALSAGARHASLVATPAHGTIFFYRSATGQSPPQEPVTVGPGAAAWVRLERVGSVVTAYYSSNGTSWTAAGSMTLSTATMYVGLVVSSELSATTSTAVFDNVAVTVPVANQAPAVSLTAPASGATFTAPGTVTVSANASDTDGTIAKVDFFAGSTLIGTDTTSPYSITWSNVAAGSYSITARAQDDKAATTTSAARTITVSVVNQPPTVSLTAPANGATFTAPASITVTATTADADGSVMQLDFYAGTTLIGTVTQQPNSVTWNNVPAGTYSLTVVATDDLGATTTSAARSITVNGAANQAPAVSLTAPASGATFTAPATIAITASASDADGTVAKVDFFAGSTLIGTDTTSPYSASWSNVVAGTYSLTAVVTDNAGATTTSAARSVTVTAANQAPTASLTAPANGATFTAPATITVSASASDSDGTVAKVDFFAGATLIGTDTTSPYSVTWSNVTAGTYALTVVATDNGGATTTSAARSITVSGGNQPPTVSLTAPANGATFTAPASITVTATTGDADGSVMQLDFYAGTTLIGTVTQQPNSVTWNNVPAGTYSLTVVATDDLGATTTSAARTITVSAGANQAPSVSLTSPVNASTFTAPATIAMTASASDADGTVAKVDFFAGSTLIGTDTTSPYSVSWSNVVAGTYSLTAVATDNAGATRTSAAVSVTVSNPTSTVTRAQFNASPDDATLVVRYVLEVFAANADPNTATPLASQDLGKPAVVNGVCDVDISQTFNALAPGSYIATVSAVGTGGSSRSAPAAFTK